MSKHDGPLFCLVEMHAGRLRLPASDRFAAQLRQLRDGDYEMVLERKRATRSHQQNRLYWGVILRGLADYTGYSLDEMHDICKAMFLPKRLMVANRHGEIVGDVFVGRSTTELTAQEFTEYLDAITAWAATLGVVMGEETHV